MKNTFCVFVVFYYFILEIFSVFKALRQQIRGIEPINKVLKTKEN